MIHRCTYTLLLVTSWSVLAVAGDKLVESVPFLKPYPLTGAGGYYAFGAHIDGLSDEDDQLIQIGTYFHANSTIFDDDRNIAELRPKVQDTEIRKAWQLLTQEETEILDQVIDRKVNYTSCQVSAKGPTWNRGRKNSVLNGQDAISADSAYDMVLSGRKARLSMLCLYVRTEHEGNAYDVRFDFHHSDLRVEVYVIPANDLAAFFRRLVPMAVVLLQERDKFIPLKLPGEETTYLPKIHCDAVYPNVSGTTLHVSTPRVLLKGDQEVYLLELNRDTTFPITIALRMNASEQLVATLETYVQSAFVPSPDHLACSAPLELKVQPSGNTMARMSCNSHSVQQVALVELDQANQVLLVKYKNSAAEAVTWGPLPGSKELRSRL